MLEGELECDPTTERRSDHGGAAKSAALHVALYEPCEVADTVTRAGLLAAAETRKVGCIDAMTGCCRLEVESPLQVSRRAETVDEEHGRAAPSAGGEIPTRSLEVTCFGGPPHIRGLDGRSQGKGGAARSASKDA